MQISEEKINKFILQGQASPIRINPLAVIANSNSTRFEFIQKVGERGGKLSNFSDFALCELN